MAIQCSLSTWHRLPEDAAHLIKIGIRQRRLRNRGRIQRKRIVRLLILTPADTTNEALIIEQDTLPSEAEFPVLARYCSRDTSDSDPNPRDQRPLSTRLRFGLVPAPELKSSSKT